MRIVDVHVHLAPFRLARAVRAALDEQHGWQIPWPIEPEEVLADLRASGADLVVSHPYAHRPGIAEGLNAHAVEFAAAHDGVLTFATVHPDDDDSPALLEQALAAGARGLKVHCPVQRVAPDDPRLRPVLDLCEHEDVPVLIHSGHGPDTSTPYTGADRLGVMLEQHPRLRVCAAHIGAPEGDAVLDLLDRHETLVVDVAAVSSNGFASTGASLERLLARADRVLYASDYPNVVHPASDVLPNLRAAGFTGPDLERVLSTNAERFLGLG